QIGRGTGNAVGLSLKSPRFLSNRWGPPQFKCLVPRPAYLSVARSRKGKPYREALHAFKSIDMRRRETDQFADNAFGQEDTFNSVHCTYSLGEEPLQRP